MHDAIVVEEGKINAMENNSAKLQVTTYSLLFMHECALVVYYYQTILWFTLQQTNSIGRNHCQCHFIHREQVIGPLPPPPLLKRTLKSALFQVTKVCYKCSKIKRQIDFIMEASYGVTDANIFA